MFHRLYARLSAAFLLLVILLAASFMLLSQWMSERYSLEIMQRLNQSVGMYVAGQRPLMINGAVDEKAMDELAARAMILNPSLEIYILDTQGRILSHRLPEDTVQLDQVDMQPIQDYLTTSRPFPILGDDPRQPDRANSFSAFPLSAPNKGESTSSPISSQSSDDQTLGYVYAIIGGQLYQQLRSSVMDSYVIQVGALMMLVCVLVTAIAGCILFFFLTRRLTRLRKEVSGFDLKNPSLPQRMHQPEAAQGGRQKDSQEESLEQNQDLSQAVKHTTADEVEQLNQAFHQMAHKIVQQFDSLRVMDENRRELIANVSHDLRTPLAAMQGYIETLIIKNGSLSEQERQDYLTIAHKHSQRLGQLIKELFELARLDAGGIEPNLEPFSLLELVHDCVQEFGLSAEQKQISLNIHHSEEDCFVVADIALIHRVLQNLIDNAIRHTPENGRVEIRVNRDAADNALIEVSDTGKGIQTHEIPYIFERFYQSQQQQPAEKIGTGLGLAIVKRILELHQTGIDVHSRINQGTSFAFVLPQYQVAVEN